MVWPPEWEALPETLAIVEAVTAVKFRAEDAGYDADRLTGISLYGCAEAIGTERQGAMRRSAHAHVRGELAGTICVKGGPKRLTRRLLAHEMAHVLVRAGHTARWRTCVTRLGHPAEAKRYEHPKRTSAVWFWTDPATGERRTGTYREMTEAKRGAA